jgi:hypothetical protein
MFIGMSKDNPYCSPSRYLFNTSRGGMHTQLGRLSIAIVSRGLPRSAEAPFTALA